MAAIFTTADRDAIKAAIVTAAVEGIASVSIAGQSVTTYSLDQLRKLLAEVQQDLAADVSHGGLRMVKLIPPGCG